LKSLDFIYQGRQPYKNDEGKRITIAYHSGKILHPKMVKSILADVGLSVDEFKKML